MTGTQEPESVSTKRQRIAELGRRHPERSFVSLAHHIDVEWLRAAWRRTRKDAASGIDGETADAYAANLEANLADLLERLKSGRYKAPAVKRVHIPKGDGRSTRPIGIPTLEDKIAQRAIAMVLEPLYEGDFHECSYGFRPGRSAHQALECLWRGLESMGGGWVIELDIRSFFDELDWSCLRAVLDEWVRDGVIRRLINKWLKAGAVEAGQMSYPDAGTPQGGVLSPLLANIFLHAVLDRWFAHEVEPRLRGRAQLVRFADDAVLAFANEHDARRVLEVLPRRFARYGLRLHPTKTRLVRFRPRRRHSEPHPGSFDFLGFSHYWTRSRRGRPTVKRKTAKDRLRRSLREIKHWCRLNRHRPLDEQWTALSQKLHGHYAYYGITGNFEALAAFAFQVRRTWVKWLGRRSQRARLSSRDVERLFQRFPLPEPWIRRTRPRRA